MATTSATRSKGLVFGMYTLLRTWAGVRVKKCLQVCIPFLDKVRSCSPFSKARAMSRLGSQLVPGRQARTHACTPQRQLLGAHRHSASRLLTTTMVAPLSPPSTPMMTKPIISHG